MIGARRASTLTGADNNAITRFKILRGLRDQGLVTPDEYRLRRQVNLGALMRYTNPPPASGLGAEGGSRGRGSWLRMRGGGTG